MAQIEKIQQEILELPYHDFASLRGWFAELEWERWDETLESDESAGRLDFLFEEAKSAKVHGELRDL